MDDENQGSEFFRKNMYPLRKKGCVSEIDKKQPVPVSVRQLIFSRPHGTARANLWPLSVLIRFVASCFKPGAQR